MLICNSEGVRTRCASAGNLYHPSRARRRRLKQGYFCWEMLEVWYLRCFTRLNMLGGTTEMGLAPPGACSAGVLLAAPCLPTSTLGARQRRPLTLLHEHVHERESTKSRRRGRVRRPLSICQSRCFRASSSARSLSPLSLIGHSVRSKQGCPVSHEEEDEEKEVCLMLGGN